MSLFRDGIMIITNNSKKDFQEVIILTATVPGTVLPLTEWSEERVKNGQAFSLITPILTATGGVTLSQLSRFTGLEGSTIQNWIKRGWVAATTGKKYNEKQVVRILLINILRSVMKLEDIVKLMSYINGDVEDESDDILPDTELYNLLCSFLIKLRGKQCIADEISQMIEENLSSHYTGEIRRKLIDSLVIMVIGYRSATLKMQMDELYSKIG